MLNKSPPFSRYKANNGKNKKKCLMHFDPDARVFVLSNWHKIQLCDEFYSAIFICLTPFSQLKFGLSNSILNHPGHATLTTWIFLKFLPVVGIIEIWKSWKYYLLTSSFSDYMAFLKNDKLMMGGAAKY